MTGEHFNLRVHSQSDMQISIVEKIYSNSNQFRKQRERMKWEHFNLRGHSQSYMQISIVEKIYSNSDQFRKQRERLFISKFNTKYKGMNKKT